MDPNDVVEDATVVERVVLVGLAGHDARGETPVRADEVRRACNDRFDDVAGRLSAGDVARTLSGFAADGILEERRPDDTSPVGKGRPTYALAADPEELVDAVAEHARTEALVAALE